MNTSNCEHLKCKLISVHGSIVSCNCISKYRFLIQRKHYIIECQKCFNEFLLVEIKLPNKNFTSNFEYNFRYLSQDNFITKQYLFGYFIVLNPIKFKWLL